MRSSGVFDFNLSSTADEFLNGFKMMVKGMICISVTTVEIGFASTIKFSKAAINSKCD